MALSAAEKQARYRRHRMGDHSRCDPSRGCRVGAEASPPEPLPEPVAEVSAPAFGPRGAELWTAAEAVVVGPLHRSLLVEACRLVDRLDRFDRVLSGGRWFFDRVVEDNPDAVEIVVDQLVSEARQGASALKAIVAELEPKPTVASGGSEKQAKDAVPTGVASLAAKLDQRRKALGG